MVPEPNSHATPAGHGTVLIRRIVARDRDEEHRVASPLELLVDLCFVVAVAQVAAELHHAVAGDNLRQALPGFLMVFFAIWWAWMNFTWFASAFDVDDLVYRLLTLVQMAGVLVIAAGVPAAFEHGDFVAITIGYVIMRIALVAQWLRAAAGVPEARAVATRYAIGVTIVQVGWIARIFMPASTDNATFVLLAIAEITVPLWAERAGPMTSWHPGHIAERYGLFTIIVLGESILAGTVAVQAALGDTGLSWSLVVIGFAALVIIFAAWSCYFARSAEGFLRRSPQSAFLWGYAHYVVFASAAAIGAGLQVAIETSEGHTEIGSVTAALAVALPVAIYLVVLGALQTKIDPEDPVLVRYVVCAVAVIAAAASAMVVALPLAIMLIAVLTGSLIVFEIKPAPDEA